MQHNLQHNEFQFSFDKFRILNISFLINHEFSKKKTIPIDTRIGIAYKYAKKENKLYLKLKVSSTEGDTPFFFDVEGEGIFSFPKEPEEETLKKIAYINCPAIIFPYVRETIADLSRRAGFKPLHLPPVNFVKFAEMEAIIKKKTHKKKAKRTKVD